MKKLIVANWKMNPQAVDEAKRLAAAIEHHSRSIAAHTEVVVCPPFVYLPALMHYTDGVQLGAQNMSWADGGGADRRDFACPAFAMEC
ncbi:MAG: triose-phosphate isomerase [Candidatus Doudnabacteria bacterium]